MIKCKNCGADVVSSKKICPYCGVKMKRPIYKKWWFYVIILFVLIGAIGSAGGGGDDAKNEARSANIGGASSEDSGAPIINLSYDTSGYYVVAPEVLFEYGQYMDGEKVLVKLEVSDTSRSYFRSHTGNEESFRYAFKCDFDSETVNKQLEEESTVTVAGIVDDSSTDKTVTLTDCVIVSDNKYTSENDEAAQIEYCAAYKTAYEEALAAALKAEREEYAAECVTLDYNDVARNPDAHKGEKVKFSGKVIQVAEGLLDSVTYRVATKGSYDDVVYVTYTRRDGESRILDGDSITVYGECDGVTTYQSLAGSVTIPSVKMKYYAS